MGRLLFCWLFLAGLGELEPVLHAEEGTEGLVFPVQVEWDVSASMIDNRILHPPEERRFKALDYQEISRIGAIAAAAVGVAESGGPGLSKAAQPPHGKFIPLGEIEVDCGAEPPMKLPILFWAPAVWSTCSPPYEEWYQKDWSGMAWPASPPFFQSNTYKMR